jgi:trk system potassium uptake protein
MRIIVIGGGDIGYAVSRSLAPQYDLFVIDHDPSVADRFSTLDVEFIAASATSEAALRRADVEHADVVIACTGFDEVNIVACATASQLGRPRTICFVSREDFSHALGEESVLRSRFGIDRVIWPEAQLADDIERIIAAPGAIDAEVFEGGRVRLIEYRIERGSPFTAGPLSEVDLPGGSLVVAVKQQGVISIPRGASRLRTGDRVVIMGTPEAMRQVQSRLHPREARRENRKVTIIGGGDVGFRLAERLEQAHGIELRLFERDIRRGEWLASRLERALVLHGDGTDLELLESEQIGRSDVLVSVIDNDERNLLASLLGRQLGVAKIITRVSKPANLRLFERVGIDVAISARAAAVEAVVHHIKGGAARLLAVLEEGQGKILELDVPRGWTPTPLHGTKWPADSLVGAIIRGPEVIVPRGKDMLLPGDRLIVFCTAASMERVRDFFETSVR